MGSHLIIDGNAVYEVDDDCMLALEKVSQQLSAEKKQKDNKELLHKTKHTGTNSMKKMDDKRKIPH